MQLIPTTVRVPAAQLWAREYQEDEAIREFFTGRGFVEVQRFTLPNQLPMVVYSFDLTG
jgi:hypothetical protein